MVTAAAPISVNELFGLDSEFNPFDPKFKRLPGEPATETEPVSLTERLREQYNAANEIKLESGQLPPQLPPSPETVQAGKPLVRRAGEATLGAAETGAGYLNQAVRSHTKFLTDIGEGVTAAAAGAVTSGAGMARASSDILNDYMARFAREGPKALLTTGQRETREQLLGHDSVQPVPAQERSPTFYRDTFKKVEADAQSWSYEPKTKVGKQTLEVISVVPHVIKEVSDFVGRRAEDLGVDPDRARLVSFATELVLFSKLDHGVRRSASGIRSSIAEHNKLLKNVKTDADLVSEPVLKSAEKIANAVDKDPKIATELDAARTRLTETSKTGEVPAAATAGPPAAPTAPSSAETRIGKARTTAEDLGVAEDIVRLTGEGKKYGQVADAIKDRLPPDMPRIQQLNLVRDTERAYREGINAAPEVAVTDAPAVPVTAAAPSGAVTPERPGAVSDYLARRGAAAPTEAIPTPVAPRTYPEVPVRPTGVSQFRDIPPDPTALPTRITEPRSAEVAAVTPPEAAPAPVTPVAPVAAATSRQQIATELLAKSLDKNATTAEINSALGQLKGYAREGLKPSGKTETGLKNLGFTDEQITDIAPRLKNVRAEQAPYYPVEREALVPATSTSAPITGPEGTVPAVSRPPLMDLTGRPEFVQQAIRNSLEMGERWGIVDDVIRYASEGRIASEIEPLLRSKVPTSIGRQELTQEIRNIRTAHNIPNMDEVRAGEGVLPTPEPPRGIEVNEIAPMFGAMGKGIAQGFRDMLWEQYQKGSTQNVARTPELPLELAKALKDRGVDIPRERFDRMINEVEAIRDSAREQGLRGEAFRKPLEEYYNNIKNELESGQRVAAELAKPDVQLTQTPDGDIAYVKSDGEVIAKVADTPAQVELAAAPPGTEVTLPPAPAVVDTTPFIEKPKRQRKVVKAKPETDPLPNESAVGTEPRPTTASELGLPATAGETRYYSTNLNSLTDTMRGVTGESVGTAAPERAALQVRRTGSAKPDAVFVDTTGMNVMTPLKDIERQVASGRMSKETGDAIIANLRKQAEVSGEPLATAHIWNGQKLQELAITMARAEGLDLYVKKGKNYELMPRDAVAGEAKLNSTDITKPSGATKAEVAALTDFKSGPIGPEALKEILESSERGLDISDRLPADLVQPYKDLAASERQGINLSERRNFIDMLKDANTVFGGGETGSLFPGRNIAGRSVMSRERRLAAQRLEADVRRVGDTFTNFFRHQLKPEEIPMFERYLEQIGNPEPPKGVGPERMSFEPTIAGDNIAKHRMRSDGKAEGPPLWESEISVIHNLRNIGQPGLMRVFENPIYLLERMGGKELYYASRSAINDYQVAKQSLSKDLKSMQKDFGPASRENIGAYGYSRTPEGRKVLDYMGKEVPTLNAKELRMYNEQQAVYADFFERINEVREATGHEPLMKVENYQTMARTLSVMERLGVTPDIMRQSAADVNAAFIKYSTTPFPHQRLRKGSTYSAELDSFRLLDGYSNNALRQIHVAPFVSKMHELIETNLPNPNQPGPMKLREQNWKLSEENANAYNVLRAWTDYIATGRSAQFKFPTKVENAISFLSSNLAYSLLSGTVRSAAVQVSTMRNTLQSLGPIATTEGAMRSIADFATGRERWNRAMEKSEVLSSRRYQDAFSGMDFSLQGLRPREVVGGLARGRVTELQSAIGSAGLKPLEWMDMAASNVSWNAAYDVAIGKMKMSEKQAIRFADDLVVKTQGSTMPNDVAAIQRSVAGKALTQFQTFLISDFNFLTREVMGIRDPRITPMQKVMNVAQFVGTTMAFNVLFEDVMHIQSPFPTLVKDVKQAVEDDSLGSSVWRLASGAAEVFPIIGASRYGKGIAGPIAEEWREFTRGMSGAPLAPDPLETGLKLAGVPGMQQIAKMQRASKRGENPYDSMMGWYSQERTTRTRSRRAGRSRD